MLVYQRVTPGCTIAIFGVNIPMIMFKERQRVAIKGHQFHSLLDAIHYCVYVYIYIYMYTNNDEAKQPTMFLFIYVYVYMYIYIYVCVYYIQQIIDR